MIVALGEKSRERDRGRSTVARERKPRREVASGNVRGELALRVRVDPYIALLHGAWGASSLGGSRRVEALWVRAVGDIERSGGGALESVGSVWERMVTERTVTEGIQ